MTKVNPNNGNETKSDINDNSSRGKMSFICFHSVNVKGNWIHLAEKIHDQELRSLQYLRYHENV